MKTQFLFSKVVTFSVFNCRLERIIIIIVIVIIIIIIIISLFQTSGTGKIKNLGATRLNARTKAYLEGEKPWLKTRQGFISRRSCAGMRDKLAKKQQKKKSRCPTLVSSTLFFCSVMSRPLYRRGDMD